MSRRTKTESSQKLIGIISTLLERQEKLYRRINDLEDYIDVLETMNFDEVDTLMEEGEVMIEFIPDEKIKKTILTKKIYYLKLWLWKGYFCSRSRKKI